MGPASAEYWFADDGGEKTNGHVVHEFPNIVDFDLSVMIAIRVTVNGAV